MLLGSVWLLPVNGGTEARLNAATTHPSMGVPACAPDIVTVCALPDGAKVTDIRD